MSELKRKTTKAIIDLDVPDFICDKSLQTIRDEVDILIANYGASAMVKLDYGEWELHYTHVESVESYNKRLAEHEAKERAEYERLKGKFEA